MKTYDLRPNYDNAKSFYGKATVKEFENGLAILTSYKTQVAAIVNGRPARLWNDYSATTMRHVNEFFKQHGIAAGGKKFWDSLPVEHENTLIIPVIIAAQKEYNRLPAA